MPPPLIMDPASVDLDHIEADIEGIRAVNPQRFELEQLSAIVLMDRKQHIIVGYKDVRPDEFWVRGHLPGYPLLPGVLICEAAAQLCSYYVTSGKLMPGNFLGFGGMESVRFRGTVRPGDRLLFIAKGLKIHHRKTVFNVQGFVGSTMVFQAEIIGMPLATSGAAPDDTEA
jgi:3-hydroxyacyl-[acyl-carrier-protein] dehydratase